MHAGDRARGAMGKPPQYSWGALCRFGVEAGEAVGKELLTAWSILVSRFLQEPDLIWDEGPKGHC